LKNRKLKKVVILGGGTAGSLAVAALAKRLNSEHYRISVIESSHIASIGLGESVLPSLVSFIRGLGLDEADFIRQTGASIKLGTRFRDWSGNEKPFFQPMGSLDHELNGEDFLACWIKARVLGEDMPLEDFVPSAVMAERRKFDFPATFPAGSPLSAADYSLHVDAGLLCRYLREYAQARKAEFIKAHVVRVNLAENGSIESVELNNREIVEGDIFLDCSGHRGLLIQEALHCAYENWNDVLPCDRAVALQTSGNGTESLCTVSTAVQNGWVWHIPIYGRVSHGHVFSSEHTSDNQAARVLLEAADGEALGEPRFIPFRNGIRKVLWSKNCIALGLAGGFLEPLVSTAIHLAIRGVENMLELFPDLGDEVHEWPVLAAEYNRRMRVEYEEILDFIVLHYYTSRRTDTEFWRRRKSVTLPDRLAARLELFAYRGELQTGDNSLFKRLNWLVVLTGMGIIPRSWHPFVDGADFASIKERMRSKRALLDEAAQRLPDSRDFFRAIHFADRK